MKIEILFATSNFGKFHEAKGILSPRGIELSQVKLDIDEKRGTLEEIAKDSALQAYKILRKPVVTEDAGLFIELLNGFPGEFSKWVLQKIGNEGIIQLLENKNRKAYFKAVVAFAESTEKISIFNGTAYGSIAKIAKGKATEGMGYDTIFIPDNCSKTFAEDTEAKMKLSHRKKAFEKLATHILKQCHE